jgi:hypothetical protein
MSNTAYEVKPMPFSIGGAWINPNGEVIRIVSVDFTDGEEWKHTVTIKGEDGRTEVIKTLYLTHYLNNNRLEYIKDEVELSEIKHEMKEDEKKQLRMFRADMLSVCSKCGKRLTNEWEENACAINMEIKIPGSGLRMLFGDKEKIGFNHPALTNKSGYQKLFIDIKRSGRYRLCLDCHRRLVRQIGDFLKNDERYVECDRRYCSYHDNGSCQYSNRPECDYKDRSYKRIDSTEDDLDDYHSMAFSGNNL